MNLLLNVAVRINKLSKKKKEMKMDYMAIDYFGLFKCKFSVDKMLSFRESDVLRITLP